jgi:hypothetical protein
MLFRQFLKTYTEVLEEPTEEELEIIQKEVEKLCAIIYDVSFRTLIARDAMRAQAAKRNFALVKDSTQPVQGGDGQPYIVSKQRPYYVN